MRSRRMQRLQGLQRLRSRRLQGLQSLRGLCRVQLRLLHLVGRLPVHLLGANSSPIVSNATGLPRDHSFDHCGSARLHTDGQGRSWRLWGVRRMLDRSQCARLKTVAPTQERHSGARWS